MPAGYGRRGRANVKCRRRRRSHHVCCCRRRSSACLAAARRTWLKAVTPRFIGCGSVGVQQCTALGNAANMAVSAEASKLLLAGGITAPVSTPIVPAVGGLGRTPSIPGRIAARRKARIALHLQMRSCHPEMAGRSPLLSAAAMPSRRHRPPRSVRDDNRKTACMPLQCGNDVCRRQKIECQ